MNAAEELKQLKRDRFSVGIFPTTSRQLFDITPEQIRKGQVIVDQQAERFTEARRGKPQRAAANLNAPRQTSTRQSS